MGGRKTEKASYDTLKHAPDMKVNLLRPSHLAPHCHPPPNLVAYCLPTIPKMSGFMYLLPIRDIKRLS